MSDDTTQAFLFPELFDRPLIARFDRPHASSDGGAILLKAADRRLGLLDALADCLPDTRDPSKVRHGLDELLGQRVYGLACGYEDANDAARLRDDPVHKLLLGRDAIGGDALASQPTLSRFENSVTRAELLRLSEALFEVVVERQTERLRGKVRTITIDLDVTDDPTHGQQELAFFHGHYRHWCYLPLLAYLTFNGEPDQHLVAAMLRPGNAPTSLGALMMLTRIVGDLQERFPRARLLVRLDGGFAGPGLLEFLDEVQVGYAVGLPSNPVLERAAEALLAPMRLRSELTGATEHVYGECRYAAGTWDRERRVVIKAEVVRHEGRKMRDNPRFVVTNLKRAAAPLRRRVLHARRDREPHQGTPPRPVVRPHQLHAVPRQPVARVTDRLGLCADAGDPRRGGEHEFRASAGVHAARTAVQARRRGRGLRPAYRAAPAGNVRVPRRVARHRRRTWGRARVAARPHPGEDAPQSSAGPAEACPKSAKRGQNKLTIASTFMLAGSTFPGAP